MSHDDVLFGYRLRLFTLAEEIGVRPACRAMGVHHSTYYRWKHQVETLHGCSHLRRLPYRDQPHPPGQVVVSGALRTCGGTGLGRVRGLTVSSHCPLGQIPVTCSVGDSW